MASFGAPGLASFGAVATGPKSGERPPRLRIFAIFSFVGAAGGISFIRRGVSFRKVAWTAGLAGLLNVPLSLHDPDNQLSGPAREVWRKPLKAARLCYFWLRSAREPIGLL